jgi:hypothetical protein
MHTAPSRAGVVELAAYRHPAPSDEDPPPNSQGARPLPPPEFTILDAVDRRAPKRTLDTALRRRHMTQPKLHILPRRVA